MHLMYTLGPDGKRQYTLKKIVDGEVTKSAHPARFSPDDKYSRYAYTAEWESRKQREIVDCLSGHVADQIRVHRHRVTLKKRYGLLMMQQSTSSEFSMQRVKARY